MTYMDAMSSTWDLGGSVMQRFMVDYPGAIDTIFARSRQAGQETWGADYPVSEALDDLQDRPAFDLYHKAHILRYRVACYRQLLVRGEASHMTDELSLEIKTMIDILTDVSDSPSV